MKKIFALILSIFLPEILLATHAMGGDISYISLGNQQYDVTYTFYRDCSGIPASSSASIVAVTSTGSNLNFVLNSTSNSPVLLHTVCPSATTTCAGGVNIGVEKWIYNGIITLPPGEVMIYHQENARSSGLTTITGAGSEDLFIYATINSTATYQGSSPEFVTDPVIILCQGFQYCIPPFVTDADGDSLVYELTIPRIGPNPDDTVTYLNGYSTQNPFTTQVPVTFNSANGELCLIPSTANEVSPVAVRVSEYRNGVLIGTVMRDMQTSVLACNNSRPNLLGLNGMPATSMTVCAGQQNCFFLTGLDSDQLDNTFINCDLGRNSTLVHTFGQRDTLWVCWTPSDSDTISNPICFQGIATDDHCPYPGVSFEEYCLTVVSSSICNPNTIPELSEYNFNCFPQPASDEINIAFTNVEPGLTFQLYSIDGVKVFSIQVSEKNIRIKTEDYPDGMYIASVVKDGVILYSEKVVIAKNQK